MKEEDKKTYELIAEEIDTDNTQKALWTKAFSDAEGDGNRTQALYIKYRFEEISNEEQEYHEDELDVDEDSNSTTSTIIPDENSDEDSLSPREPNLKNKESLGETSPPKNPLHDAGMTTSELVRDGNQYFFDYQNKISPQKRIQESIPGIKKQSYPKVTPKIDGFLVVAGFFLIIFCIFFGLTSFIQFTQVNKPPIWVLNSDLHYGRPNLFIKYVGWYEWRMFGEFLLMLFLTFKFFKKSKHFVDYYLLGIILNILVTYSFYYQIHLEIYSNFRSDMFLLAHGILIITTIIYLTFFLYFLFSSKVKQTFIN